MSAAPGDARSASATCCCYQCLAVQHEPLHAALPGSFGCPEELPAARHGAPSAVERRELQLARGHHGCWRHPPAQALPPIAPGRCSPASHAAICPAHRGRDASLGTSQRLGCTCAASPAQQSESGTCATQTWSTNASVSTEQCIKGAQRTHVKAVLDCSLLCVEMGGVLARGKRSGGRLRRARQRTPWRHSRAGGEKTR